MTDLERFIELYKSFGIDLEAENTECDESNKNYYVHLQYHEKFCGHHGFFSTVEFDENGKFLRQGFWE
jgi:hypothetical protein